ncbi:hypothetical protein [Oribacterium sinus]
MQMEIDRVSNYSKNPICSEGVDTADKWRSDTLQLGDHHCFGFKVNN